MHCSEFPRGNALRPAEIGISSFLKRAKPAVLLAMELANAHSGLWSPQSYCSESKHYCASTHRKICPVQKLLHILTTELSIYIHSILYKGK